MEKILKIIILATLLIKLIMFFFNSNKEHFIENAIEKNFEFQQKIQVAKTPVVDNSLIENEKI